MTLEELRVELFKDPILKKMYDDNKIYNEIALVFLKYMYDNSMTQEELCNKLLMDEKDMMNIFSQEFSEINVQVLIESLKVIGYKLKIEVSDN